MTAGSNTNKLEQRLERYFDHYSLQRLVMATVMVGLGALVSSLLAYMFFNNGFIAAAVFMVCGLVLVNLAIITVVPPTQKLAQSRSLLVDAVNQPSLIKSVDPKGVKIENKKGQLITLQAYERRAWDTIITPFFLRATSNRGKVFRQAMEVERHSENLENLESKRNELLEQQKRFEEAQKKLNAEREEMERRSQELIEAENLVISRLSEVEVAEAQMAQMKDDLDSTQRRHDSGSGADVAAKEAELKAKEAEIEKLKLGLLEDRRIVEEQKTELNRMKGEILQEVEAQALPGNLAREGQQYLDVRTMQEKLEARARELEAAARELESRSRYVDEAEESLVERLGQLTEREAMLQQSEINAGVRKD